MSEENAREIMYGRHAVEELLKSGKGVDTLFISSEMDKKYAGYFVALAKQAGTVVKNVPADKLTAMCGGERHQGVAASVAEIDYLELDELLQISREKSDAPFLLLCDGVEDPHNLGALLRSALLCGVHGAVITKRGSPGITPVVMKASAGAAALLPVARVTNLGEAIRTLKKQNLFVWCADMDGTPLYKRNLQGAVAIVVGSEGRGVSPLTKKLCDGAVSLPMAEDKGVDSFNVAVAGGIIMHHIFAQRCE